MGYGVVDDLLSTVSRLEQGMDNSIEITMIPRSQIEKNPRNDRSINGIDELAQDIKMCGLEQPLVVYQLEDGDYRLLTGERRITAIDLLIELGNLPCPEECYLPCVIKDLEEYDLPLNDELKEKYAIQRTNRFNRNPTDADIMKDYREWKEIITALKAEGYEEFVVGKDEENKDIKQSLKGRTREIAQKSMAMHVSTGQLAKYDAVEKKAIPEVIEAIEQNRLTIAVAEKVSSLEPNAQLDFINSTENLEQISKQDYDTYAKNVERKAVTENPIPNYEKSDSEVCYKVRRCLSSLTAEVEKETWSAALATVQRMERYIQQVIESGIKSMNP